MCYHTLKNIFTGLHYSLIALLLILLSFPLFSQVLNEEETKLYHSMMEYRKEMGLPGIPVSKSLTLVAQTHVFDLAENKPDTGKCNTHSWSANGNWSACCYTPDHKQAKCLWLKPGELTTYKGYGYEIACGSNVCCSDFIMSAEFALQSWKSGPGHHAVIVNRGIWRDKNWGAIGIGVYKGFAVVWFGEDREDHPVNEKK